MRKLITGLCAALALAWSLPALAAPQQTIVGPNGTAAQVDSHGLQVDCTNGCSGGGGGGNVTIVGPLGTGAPAAGVTTTLDSTDAAALQTIITNTGGSIPAGSALIGKVGIDQTTPGTSNGVYITGGSSPCYASVQSFADFNSSSSGGNLITGTTGKITYICSIRVTVSTQTQFSLCEATSTACSGGTPAAVYCNTGTTAANGCVLGFDATHPGGIVDNGGTVSIAKTATTGQNVDVLFATTNSPTVNVHVGYVQK